MTFPQAFLRVVMTMLVLSSSAALAQNCESLSGFQRKGVTVNSAIMMPTGGFHLADDHASNAKLPEFCRVSATLRPTSDSEIRIEVWMPPKAAWNGKFQGTGNGGWGGSLNYRDMAEALQRGYASSSTDTGHLGGRATFAPGHPEKLIDFGYRSIHEMTETAKALIAAYYGSAPKLSYFAGCSSGGRQALMEAQRFPEDYDGIVAGAPTNNWTRLMFGRIWVAQATLSNPESYIPRGSYATIHQAVLAQCDALDGVKDGVIEDPTACRFDPAVLQCKPGKAGNCLTRAQVNAAHRIYTAATNSRTGEQIFPPMMPGSELEWETLAGGPEPIQLADDFFKYVVFGYPKWDFRTLNFGSDVEKALAADGGVLTANDPDLQPFFRHGGKLIEYQGWTDQQVMPLNSVHYYQSVQKVVGSSVGTSYRLFLVPGMNHCGGGDGPNKFDALHAMEQWREEVKAPDAMLATHARDGVVDRTRPLCPYPQVAHYSSVGSTDDAANFSCKAR